METFIKAFIILLAIFSYGLAIRSLFSVMRKKESRESEDVESSIGSDGAFVVKNKKEDKDELLLS